MARAVFILGAGASAPFGVPTLLRIFQDPQAREYLRRERFLKQALDEHFWQPRGHTLATSHLSLSVEEILTVVRDYEHQAYGVESFLEPNSERFVRCLYIAIKRAIYDLKNTRGMYLNDVIRHARRFEDRTWATFNWDCIFEASYYYSSSQYFNMRHNPRVVIDLQNWRNPTARGDVFLKLHGGVNWWYDGNAITYLPFGANPDLNNRWAEYERQEAQGTPVILEPSYYKYADPVYDLLRGQWDYFVKALLEADVVVVLGYSLPEADTEARRALTLGFQSNPTSRWLVVDQQQWVCDRYKRLFGERRLECVCDDLRTVFARLPELIDRTAPPPA